MKAKDFLSLATSRRTSYEFLDKKIKKSDLDKIIEAARWTPSSSNMQPWKFVVTMDKKRITDLMATAYYGAFHTNPDIIISVVLDSDLCGGTHQCVVGNKVGMMDAHLCAGMAALSMALEAEDLGIASCILTPNEDKAPKILGLRKDDRVPLMIGFGYEKNGSFKRERERKPQRELVSQETFRWKK